MLIDLHAHSSPRSSCSRATLQDLVDAARARGMDALCLTEHDVVWSPDELAAASRKTGMLLLGGVELSTDVGHVLAYGPLRRPLWTKYRFEQLLAEAETEPLALVLPHPLRREAGERAARAGRVPPTPAEVTARPAWLGVHAVEAGSTQTTADEQALTAAALAVVARPCVAGSDAHGPARAGSWATEVADGVRTVEQLVTEIRTGRVAAHRGNHSI